jgi:GntR family transcriptional regulator
MTVSDGEEMPVYLRLRGMIALAIVAERYAEGEQLPSVRAFASETGTNPLTVAKAYQCLQDEGYVTVKRGVGMFVAHGATDRLRTQEREVFLTKIWPRVRGLMERLNIEPAELLARDSV